MMRWVAILALAATMFILFDHAMRADQMNICQQFDDIKCPKGAWIWSK